MCVRAYATRTTSAHAKKACHNVRVKVTDAKKVRAVTIALHMIDTLRTLVQ